MARRARNYRTDAALRPQPARTGLDFWLTTSCLIGVLTSDVLAHLPAGCIWEPAAGAGGLANAIRSNGREVVATDIKDCDFLKDDPPRYFAAIITNPPFNKLDAFVYRALEYLDAGVTQSVLLLMRSDHLNARRRSGALARATELRFCPWRPRWIPGTKTSPRWSFVWVTWRRDYRGPPTAVWATHPDKAAARPRRTGAG